MSRLIILTRPSLVPGFQLAGVDVYGAEDIESAEEMIEQWLNAGEEGLLAVDDGLLEGINKDLIKRLETTGKLLYIPIPGGRPLGMEASRRRRIAEMIRRAIGFHITFKGEEAEREK